MMTGYNREVAKTVHKEATDLMKALAAKHGLSLGKCNATFDSASLAFSIKLVDEAAEQAGHAATFTANAQWLDYDAAWLGTTINIGAKAYTITGYNPSRRTKPVTLMADGKTYFYDVAGMILAKKRAGTVLKTKAS